MDRFIRIEVSIGSSAVNRFTGEIVSSRPSLVDTVRLFDLATGSCVSAIQSYPHYVESPVVLVQRLLNQRGLSEPLNSELPEEATVALTLSRDPQAVFATTLLQIEYSDRHLLCRIVTDESLVEKASSPGPVIRHTAASAVVWAVNSTMGRQACAALPTALCSIPIRARAGQTAFVRMADVPEFARRRFCKRTGISLSDEQIDATVWKTYLRSVRHERQCELTLAQMGPAIFKHSVSL